jgi:hypothetical protein
MDEPIAGKKYRHFRGNEYWVLMIAHDSENPEKKLVIYQATYGDHEIWVRPIEMWFQEVEPGVKRFTMVE